MLNLCVVCDMVGHLKRRRKEVYSVEYCLCLIKPLACVIIYLMNLLRQSAASYINQAQHTYNHNDPVEPWMHQTDKSFGRPQDTEQGQPFVGHRQCGAAPCCSQSLVTFCTSTRTPKCTVSEIASIARHPKLEKRVNLSFRLLGFTCLIRNKVFHNCVLCRSLKV